MPLPIVFATLLAAAGPQGSPSDWAKPTVRTLLTRAQAASRAPTLEAQDTELAEVGGAAYGIKRNAGEPNELFAQRVVRTREPDHPNVKKGQWLSALARLFYADVGSRCETLARFETNRDDRIWLEKMAGEAKNAAKQIAGTLQMTIDGLEGFVEPLPIVPGGKPDPHGAMAMVHQQKITIETMDRIVFVGHQPPPEASRTARGSLKEVYAALKQYNVSAQMLGQYEGEYRKNLGHFRAVIPQEYPALYLNELVRGALEADMHTLHLMVMSKRGDLGELHLAVQWGVKPPKKPKKAIIVTCANDIPMQKCAERIVHAQTMGVPIYGLE